MQRRIRTFPDPESLSRGVVERWIELSAAAIDSHGGFHVALSGGTTPKRTYGMLALPENAARIDWRRTHIYFGDERCVPPDSPDSNYGMAKAALLDHVEIPDGNVHRMEGERDPQEAAQRYEALLRDHRPEVSEGLGRFDLVLLGLGNDGHTASLFPDTAALAVEDRAAVANFVGKLDAWRLSLTYPVINRARHVLVLAEGEGKAEIVGEILNLPTAATRYPIQAVRPQGEMVWYLDEAAAGRVGG